MPHRILSTYLFLWVTLYFGNILFVAFDWAACNKTQKGFLLFYRLWILREYAKLMLKTMIDHYAQPFDKLPRYLLPQWYLLWFFWLHDVKHTKMTLLLSRKSSFPTSWCSAISQWPYMDWFWVNKKNRLKLFLVYKGSSSIKSYLFYWRVLIELLIMNKSFSMFELL